MNATIPINGCRVYFNRMADYPNVWSVDTGPGTPEICCSAVRILAPSTSVYSPEAGNNVTAPKAWLQVEGREIRFLGGARAEIE